MTYKYEYFKIQWKTKLYNKNQKVFILKKTGQQAAFVIGKYRGSGRYVTSWVKWEKLGPELWPKFKTFQTDYRIKNIDFIEQN